MFFFSHSFPLASEAGQTAMEGLDANQGKKVPEAALTKINQV
jgi:hypothetical protein